MYKVATPSEYLVITGGWIADIKLTRKSWVLPWQKCTRIDLSPVNYTFEVQAMSAEKLPFILPAVFTIGPREDDHDSLLKYAKLMSSHDTTSNHVNELVQGVIEGETRVLAASMTMEEIFRGTKQFKQEVFDKVQLELDQFGLLIYNANVKQLVDVPGHEYFSYIGQKVQMEAANQAKIDVAEAKMHGEVGAKSRDGLTVQNAAKIDAETKIYATERQGEGKKQQIKVETEIVVYKNQQEAVAAEAATALAMKKAGWAKEAEVAQVESRKAVAIREAELQREVERMNALTTTEKLKADFLSKANVEYETKAQEANADVYKKQKLAEAYLYQKQKESEAEFYARKQKVDADLYAKLKEAEATKAVAEAQAVFISSTMAAFKGNYAAMRDYLMIERGLFKDIATINGDAVKGLQPRLSVWTGAGDASGDAMKQVSGLYQMLPPLMATVHEQTGMIPPPWLGQLAQTDQQPLTR